MKSLNKNQRNAAQNVRYSLHKVGGTRKILVRICKIFVSLRQIFFVERWGEVSRRFFSAQILEEEKKSCIFGDRTEK
jgi:hypothetical protein